MNSRMSAVGRHSQAVGTADRRWCREHPIRAGCALQVPAHTCACTAPILTCDCIARVLLRHLYQAQKVHSAVRIDRRDANARLASGVRPPARRGVGQQHETCACLQIEPHAGACRCPLQRLPVKVVREAIRSRQLRLLLLVDDVVIRWQVPLGKGFPVCKWKRLTGLGCVHHAAQAAHAATGTGTSARIGPS